MPQGPTNIFQNMTQPTPAGPATPPPAATPPTTGGTPNNLAQFLQMLASRNQAQYQPAQSYMSQHRGLPGSQQMYTVDQNSPLKGVHGLLNSNPFNLNAFHDSNGMLDEAQFMSYNTIGDKPLFMKDAEGNWAIDPNGRYGELNNQFKGLDFRIEKDPYDDNKQKLVWNEDALPRDAFGGFGGGEVEGYEDGRVGTLMNRDLVYDDPFYGRITAPQNRRQHEDWFDKFNEMLGPILLSVAGMGLGGALGGAGLLGGGLSPSTMMSLGQGVGGALGGNPGRLLQSIISMGLPMAGLSGMPLNLARMGTGFFSNMLNNRGGRG